MNPEAQTLRPKPSAPNYFKLPTNLQVAGPGREARCGRRPGGLRCPIPGHLKRELWGLYGDSQVYIHIYIYTHIYIYICHIYG